MNDSPSAGPPYADSTTTQLPARSYPTELTTWLRRLTIPEVTPVWLKITLDLAALIGLSWFAWYHAGFLLRDDLYLYGDHPGQFYRLWQLLGVIWPEEHRFIGWSPYWYAGYPEMQFYPPGFAMAGWLLWIVSFKQLSLVTVYQTLVFVSFVLPAVSFYLLLAWGLGDRLAGLAAAWLTMIAPFALGGAFGVIIGLLGERLAYGLMPVAVLSGLWLLRSRRKTWPWLSTGFILAGILLLHPYQAIVPTGVLGLYALFCGRGWPQRWRWLVMSIGLAFGLTAFWWFPLGLRQHFFIPLIEAPLLEIQSNLSDMWWFEGMGWLLAAALLGPLFRQGRRRWLPWATFVAGAGMLGFIFFDHYILVERLNFFALDPVRLISGVTFALFVGLGLGLSELAWLGVRLLRRRAWAVLALPLVLIVPWLIYSHVAREFDFAEWMTRWQPAPDRTPIFLSQAEAKYDLQDVWAVMAETPGRVLFTSHYGLFFDIPTSLKAATPVLSGREIVGGTFTHRTPVGSYLWLGRVDPPVLRGKVEHRDDRTLAGIAWESMSDEFLFNLARRLNITLIATTATDTRARAFLDSSPRFKPVWSNRLFRFYEVVGYEPAWATAHQANAHVTRYDRRAIDVQITGSTPGATLSVKVTHYDLWQAEAEGRRLPIQTDRYGLMTLDLPPGDYTLRLRYQPGWPEQLGSLISLTTIVAIAGYSLMEVKKLIR